MAELPQIAKGSMLLIRTDGSEIVMPERPSIKRIADLIGAKLLDFVAIGKLTGSDLMMAVDDLGYEFEIVDKATGQTVSAAFEAEARSGHFEHRPAKALKPVNRRGTEYYHAICKPGTTHQIVGDVVIVHGGDFGGT